MISSRTTWPVAVALLAAACSGPVVPLQVTNQLVPLAVIMGEREAVVTAPVPVSLPPSTPVALPPIIIRVPAPDPPAPEAPVPAPLPPPDPCPPFSPIAPVVAAGPFVDAPPVEASYPYRARVSTTFGADSATFADDSTWTIRDVRVADGEWVSYVVEVAAGDVVTQTTWLVMVEGLDTVDPSDAGAPDPDAVRGVLLDQIGIPPEDRPEDPDAMALPTEPGLYLESLVREDGSTFTPAAPIAFARFPLTGGDSFDAVGTDGVTTMTFTSTVGARTKINACGTPIEAWQIDLTAGTIATTATNGTTPVVGLERSIWLAPQFGGLIVADESRVSGTDLPTFPVALGTQSFTINVEPEHPAAPR